MKWILEDNHGCTDLPPTFEPADRAARDQYIEVYHWCTEQFGSSRPGPENRWYSYGYHLSFRRPEDALAFKLRWG